MRVVDRTRPLGWTVVVARLVATCLLAGLGYAVISQLTRGPRAVPSSVGAHLQQWQRTRSRAYQFVYFQDGFEQACRATIMVRNDVVASLVDQPGGTPCPRLTIDDVFNQVERDYRHTDVTVAWHPVMGYPSRVDTGHVSAQSDDGVEFGIASYLALPAR